MKVVGVTFGKLEETRVSQSRPWLLRSSLRTTDTVVHCADQHMTPIYATYDLQRATCVDIEQLWLYCSMV